MANSKLIVPAAITPSPVIVGAPVATTAIANTIGVTALGDPYTYVNGGIGYTNSYVDFAAAGYQNSCYYKDGRGIVHVVVCCKNGTANTSMFTLPAGYRPAASIIVAAFINGVQNFVKFAADGTVTELLAGVTTGGILCVADFPGVN